MPLDVNWYVPYHEVLSFLGGLILRAGIDDDLYHFSLKCKF